ncbi:RNA-guided pseudouridylation complex pseudouridine synthase subunit Cbf5 [Candidatus Woesearchaeota archaeon CG10_big_fil_rev_8_21_14_0_10_44_13]|nr:MAG: RNA-guided pseudouridylation complex pseudouridine synthase subunit Cbf5 [Candidatus Woesearchaeota archaeon CG10_big_fil_rev_8_21_14_0_10_44_13]
MSVTQGKLPFEGIKREILVRRETETSPKFGKKPEDRDTGELIAYGVINIDKPKGPTSHQVSAYVKQIMGVSKSGHSGTLDPKVTGSLIVALDKATKVTQGLLTAGKEYTAIMHIHDDLEEYDIYKACGEFVGKIRQMPPIKSSVKRQMRTRSIYYLDILEVDGRDVLFRVGSEAGTYIRKLIHDIGQKLGCGAHMAELRRTKVGPFDESTLVTMQDLQDAFWIYKNKKDDKELRKMIQPMENAVAHLPKIWVMDTTVNSLCHGALLHVPGIAKAESNIEPEQLVAIITLKGELVATARAKMNSSIMAKSERGIAAKSERVFMEPDVYPRVERV